MFVDHTLDTAPAAARRPLKATVDKLGYLPAPMARLAASPQLLDGFLKLSAMFETTSLEPVAREVVIMTVAVRNGCHVCVAMHTAMLGGIGADAELVAALREQRPLPDAKLEALRAFTIEVMAAAGGVDDVVLKEFLEHGYTTQQALEVVLGIGAYTLSTFANRMTKAPLDYQLAAFA
ncbi:carboxymuconolactone decarboxylase family protein [Kutzneria sp. 744]|uniref:carboxymuconolactone decarboxylase family protein n=1 Tax=Kutzneria sp. (strain 744) TaxID=345341 RepID=UPI0003EECF99|nr:carboxymuconolactone decarboxylase family protein [Kutzneria sp. 744]EWM11476.1 alkylhydroperoxidase AhpD domain protein [Kutzneria sp. 744]